MQYRENSSVVLRKGNKYLIVKKPREKDAWQFPQGGVDEEEEKIDAAKREFKEECGNANFKIIKESKNSYKYEWSEETQKERGFLGQNVNFFLGEFLDSNPKITVDNNEIVDFKFVEKEDFPKFFDRKEYLEKAFEVIDEF